MPRKNLVYTVAFDPPGSSGHRALAKMLASSLLKTYADADIRIFRNTEAPLFLVAREGLEETFIPTPELHGIAGAEYSWCWKYRVAPLIDTSSYDKIAFLDCDSLALRNPDHLFQGNWDIAYKTEPGLRIICPQFSCYLSDEEMTTLWCDGVNSGTIIVRASRFHEVMQEWERIDTAEPPRARHCSDQASWNRLLLDTKLKIRPFPEGEVQFPMYLNSLFKDYHKAALVHNLGGDIVEKVHFTFGLYMQNFYCDPTALFLQFLEV
jgi:hypothetical protein